MQTKRAPPLGIPVQGDATKTELHFRDLTNKIMHAEKCFYGPMRHWVRSRSKSVRLSLAAFPRRPAHNIGQIFGDLDERTPCRAVLDSRIGADKMDCAC